MTRTLLIGIGIACVLLAAAGCKDKKTPDTGNKPNLKISVRQTGDILADGQKTTLADLENRLKLLKEKEGVVFYYREEPKTNPPPEDPPPQAMQIMNLIIKAGLPVTFSSKPDFSDYVGADGQSHPRPIEKK